MRTDVPVIQTKMKDVVIGRAYSQDTCEAPIQEMVAGKDQ